MRPEMLPKGTAPARGGYGGALAFVIEIIADFFDQFADRPPAFHFPARDEEIGVFGGTSSTR